MASVELLSNPSPHLSSHRWIATGINSLTRLNKISSLPFYVPNDTMKSHQFRLLLLKGVEPAKDPAEDSVELIVEYIPAPDDPGDAKAPRGCSITVSAVAMDQTDESEYQSRVDSFVSDRMSHNSHGNYATSSRSSTDASWCLTDVVFFSAENPQICFTNFLIPSRLEALTRGSDEAVQVAVLVAITTGVNVLTEGVATMAYSMWSSLSSSVAQWMNQTARVYHQHREEFSMIPLTSYIASAAGVPPDGTAVVQRGRSSDGRVQDSPRSRSKSTNRSRSSSRANAAGGTVTDSPVVVLPWDNVPPAWQQQQQQPPLSTTNTSNESPTPARLTAPGEGVTTNDNEEHRRQPGASVEPASSSEAWRHLVRDRIVEDDGTFLYGPEREVSAEARAFLLRTGISYQTLVEVHTRLVQDTAQAARLSRELMKQPAFHGRRYELVPRLVSKQDFWMNYLWKVGCLALCVNDSQVRAVITVLNAPPLQRRAVAPDAEQHQEEEEERRAKAALADAREGLALLQESLRGWNGNDDVELVEAAVHAGQQHVHRLLELPHRIALGGDGRVIEQTLAALRARIAEYEELRSRKDGSAEHTEEADRAEESDTERNVVHSVRNDDDVNEKAEHEDEEINCDKREHDVHDSARSSDANHAVGPATVDAAVEDAAEVRADGRAAEAPHTRDGSASVLRAAETTKGAVPREEKNEKCSGADEPVTVQPTAEPALDVTEEDIDFPKMPWEDE